MRSDEIFMKKVIEEKFLKNEYNNQYEIIKGDEPPDYYIKIGEKTIALELTQCKAAINKNGKIEKLGRQTYTSSILKFIEKLNEDFELFNKIFYF